MILKCKPLTKICGVQGQYHSVLEKYLLLYAQVPVVINIVAGLGSSEMVLIGINSANNKSSGVPLESSPDNIVFASL